MIFSKKQNKTKQFCIIKYRKDKWTQILETFIHEEMSRSEQVTDRKYLNPYPANTESD